MFPNPIPLLKQIWALPNGPQKQKIKKTITHEELHNAQASDLNTTTFTHTTQSSKIMPLP